MYSPFQHCPAGNGLSAAQICGAGNNNTFESRFNLDAIMNPTYAASTCDRWVPPCAHGPQAPAASHTHTTKAHISNKTTTKTIECFNIISKCHWKAALNPRLNRHPRLHSIPTISGMCKISLPSERQCKVMTKCSLYGSPPGFPFATCSAVMY